MKDDDIRRIFLSDEEWQRASLSWRSLKPRKNFNTWQPDDETEKVYFERLCQAGFTIPYLVIEQWIYPHYYNREMVRNYAWVDFDRVRFLEIALSVASLQKLYVIKEYQDYVQRRSIARPFTEFNCVRADLETWQTNSTWRVPPVVLDAATFTDIPRHAEIGGALQLIEGHTRLGYLLAMERAGMLGVREHTVFLLQAAD